MNKKSNQSSSGVTLVELLIVLALISVVLAVIYSMFFFGNTTFSRGETQYGLQSESRLALETAMKDIRYATDVRLINTTSPEAYETIIYFNNNSIVKKFGETTDIFPFHSENSQPLLFTKTGTDTIKYTLTGQDKGRTFSLESDISLLNYKTITYATGTAIAYITPEAYRAKDNAPTITLPTPNTNTKTSISFIYNRPKNSYTITYAVTPKGTNKVLKYSDVTVQPVVDLGTDSMITFSLDLGSGGSAVNLSNDDRIDIILTTSFDPNPYLVTLIYSSAGSGVWNIQ